MWRHTKLHCANEASLTGCPLNHFFSIMCDLIIIKMICQTSMLLECTAMTPYGKLKYIRCLLSCWRHEMGLPRALLSLCPLDSPHAERIVSNGYVRRSFHDSVDRIRISCWKKTVDFPVTSDAMTLVWYYSNGSVKCELPVFADTFPSQFLRFEFTRWINILSSWHDEIAKPNTCAW